MSEAESVQVLSVESTPNPNARKFNLSASVSAGPRSFRSPEEGVGDEQAAPFFAVPGVAVLLINGSWISVNKAAEADWRTVERGVRAAVASLSPTAEGQ